MRKGILGGLTFKREPPGATRISDKSKHSSVAKAEHCSHSNDWHSESLKVLSKVLFSLQVAGSAGAPQYAPSETGEVLITLYSSATPSAQRRVPHNLQVTSADGTVHDLVTGSLGTWKRSMNLDQVSQSAAACAARSAHAGSCGNNLQTICSETAHTFKRLDR